MTRAASTWMDLCEQLLAIAGDGAELVAHEERAWASPSFRGTRHQVRIRIADGVVQARAEQLQRALPDHEFALPGCFVADAQVSEIRRDFSNATAGVTCELLLIED